MKKYILIVVIIVAVSLLGWFFKQDIIIAFAKNPFPIVATDNISSWDFKGAYTGNQELEQKAFSEISRIKSLFRKSDYSDYELYVSIANQYELLGDGTKEYKFLGMALLEDSTEAGLAWFNMGRLMEKLGAYNTAKVAYERAVEAQAAMVYSEALNDLLFAHFPDEIK